MSVQVVETYVVWVGKTDRIASFRKVEGYEDIPRLKEKYENA